MATYPEDLDHPLSRGELSLLGIGWREAAGPLWRSPYRGVHVWSTTDPTLNDTSLHPIVVGGLN